MYTARVAVRRGQAVPAPRWGADHREAGGAARADAREPVERRPSHH